MIDRSRPVPDGMTALGIILWGKPMPEGWGERPAPTVSHACSSRMVGVADFIGYMDDLPDA